MLGTKMLMHHQCLCSILIVSLCVCLLYAALPPSGKGKLVGDDEERNATGLGVGLVFLFLMIVLVVGAFIIILFWYRK